MTVALESLTPAQFKALPMSSELYNYVKQRKPNRPTLSGFRQVMASPPTITYAANVTHTITNPLAWLAQANAAPSPLFSYTFGTNIKQTSPNAPLYGAVSPKGVNYGATVGATLGANGFGVSFAHQGRYLEISVGDNGVTLYMKVNGQYASMSPVATTGNTGAQGLAYVDFGSSAYREIELRMWGGTTGAPFYGIYTGPTDLLYSTLPRGPRVFIMGDSFGEGTGASLFNNGWIPVFADLMGWDHVYQSCVGGTGITNNSAGNRVTWVQRVATDIAPYAPDIFILQGSTNDSSAAQTDITTGAQTIINTVMAANPNCKIIMTGVMANKGVGFLQTGYYNVNDWLKAVAASNGIPFINLLEQPLFTDQVLTGLTGALASAATGGATALSSTTAPPPSSVIKFADNSRAFVRSINGAGPYNLFIDGLAASQASGATWSVVGPSLWTGTGRVGATTGLGNCDLAVFTDGIHPTDFGYMMIAGAIAEQYYRFI